MATDLLDNSCIVVCCRLYCCHIGKGRLIWRALQDAEEILEVLQARWTANKEDAGQLHLHHELLRINESRHQTRESKRGFQNIYLACETCESLHSGLRRAVRHSCSCSNINWEA